MSIIWMNCLTLIKSDIWLPLVIAGAFMVLNIFIFFIVYDPRNNKKKEPAMHIDQFEIERQLKRQTDILERDRWDRISGYEQGKK